jgi:hypothetical protein
VCNADRDIRFRRLDDASRIAPIVRACCSVLADANDDLSSAPEG